MNTKEAAVQISWDKEKTWLVFQVERRWLILDPHSFMVELCMWRRERSERSQGTRCLIIGGKRMQKYNTLRFTPRSTMMSQIWNDSETCNNEHWSRGISYFLSNAIVSREIYWEYKKLKYRDVSWFANTALRKEQWQAYVILQAFLS